MIDARAPLLAELTGWLRAIGAHSGRVAFNTHHAACFGSVAGALGERGYTVVDSATIDPADPCPRIVYHRTTADTVHVVGALLRHHEVDPSRCCALLDRVSGLEELAQLGRETGHQVASVCSALIYQRLFEAVRARLLDDADDATIQAWLDRGATPPAAASDGKE